MISRGLDKEMAHIWSFHVIWVLKEQWSESKRRPFSGLWLFMPLCKGGILNFVFRHAASVPARSWDSDYGDGYLVGRYQVSFSTTQDFLPVFYVSLSGTFAAFKFEFYFVGCTCVADGCSMLQPFLWLFQSTRDQTPSLFGLILFAFPLARFGTCFARMFQCVLQICNTKVSQSILSALERTSEIQTSIFACRTIIYATTVPKLLYDEVKLVCDDCKSGYVKRSCRIPIPQSLLEWQGGGSLILLCLLIASWNCAHCILFLLGHDFPWFFHLTRDECGVGSFFFVPSLV